ncbi:hypothetical protein KEM60_00609 [Austwickia sp. TVS 96-490-7B]|uniref:alpha/beta hydrolase n=1 Tax=Austwickia sp. TVS 96-490-7B TaxID=2830843 RepID=UPI001C569E10|nr:alpha/beta hydrolase [Austwickia sp. TVS 96-490-7B]MBW3084422.1 hypothetical protein [Austwickia sp. TVS 96-490-7B]
MSRGVDNGQDPPAAFMRHLSTEIRSAAEDLEHALTRCESLHDQFVRAAEDSRTWGRLEEALTDELRHRRLAIRFLTAAAIPDLLRSEADTAAIRFPDLAATGERLPPLPADTAPAAVASWWDGLSPAEKQVVTERTTSWCGRTDGLPAAVRHNANLITLAEEIHARAGGVLDEVAAASASDGGPLPRHTGTDDADDRERRDLRGLLKLRALLSPLGTDLGVPESVVPAESLAALDDITTPLDQRGLYLLDAREYPLRTAVVLGDLERAHTVVLHVPGTTTTVDLRLYREAMWMSALRDEAGRILGDDRGGRDGIAVVDWIGYRAPYDIATRRALGESGIRWIVPGEATDRTYARQAAPLLARCAQGLRATLGPDVRLVASGHSYGASVLGLALTQTEVFDACIVTGCPGLFTSDISTLHVPDGQFYAAVATGDVVTRLGIFGPEVNRLPGVHSLAPVPHLAVYPDGKAWTRFNMGHESYYDRGSSLLHDLAAAVVGEDVPHRWPSWAT